MTRVFNFFPLRQDGQPNPKAKLKYDSVAGNKRVHRRTDVLPCYGSSDFSHDGFNSMTRMFPAFLLRLAAAVPVLLAERAAATPDLRFDVVTFCCVCTS